MSWNALDNRWVDVWHHARSQQSEAAALRVTSRIVVLTCVLFAACTDPEQKPTGAGVAAQVKPGRYQCRTVGSAEPELRSDLEVQGTDAYAVGDGAGRYSYDAATRVIEWRSGPFGSDGWVGRYTPQGVDGYATTSIEVWDRSDLEAGYQNPLQRCQHSAEQAVTPPSPPAARFEVTYEVSGSGTAHISFMTPDGMELLQSQALPWSKTVVLIEGARAYLRSEGTENGQLAECRIWIDGEAADASEPAPYSLCDAPMPNR